MGWWRRWSAYWFAPAPVLDLAITRIVVVACQLHNLQQGLDLEGARTLARLPDARYDPLPMLHLLIWPLGWDFRPPLAMIGVIHWTAAIAALLALIGYRTNASLAVCALGSTFLTALRYSFDMKVHHGGGVMVLALAALALSPAGAALSVDELLGRMRRAASTLRLEPLNWLEGRVRFAGWPLRAVQWLFALIYGSAALSKLRAGGLDWMNGYTLQYYWLFEGLRREIPLAVWLSSQHALSVALSWATILFESTFFLILIRPALVWLYIPAGIGMHVGISLTMHVSFLSFMACYTACIPWSATFSRLSRRWAVSPSARPEVLYDGRCPLCLRAMTLLGYADWGNRLVFSDLEGRWAEIARRYPAVTLEECLRHMHVVFPDGSIARGFFAFRRLLRHLPPLWPLLPLFYAPLAGRVGPWIYEQVACRRRRIQPCEAGVCEVEAR